MIKNFQLFEKEEAKKAFKPDHKHLIIKGSIKKVGLTEKQLEKWLLELIEKIDMELLMGPYTKRVDDKKTGDKGITAGCIISTSHIFLHIWETGKIPTFQFDVYSCKNFDPDVILEHLKELGLDEYDYWMIDRNKEIKVLEKEKEKEK